MFTCTICELKYNSKLGFNKHTRTKDEKKKTCIFVINVIHNFFLKT
jgi:hypothetical protein